MKKAKKTKWAVLGIVALALILSACGKSSMSNMDMGKTSSTNSASSSNAGSGSEVTVVSSNWKWELSKTTFKKGEAVTFSIQGKDGVHGFAIDGTDINVKVGPGETKKVTWTPDKTGEFTIKCSIMCGTGHADMVQKITVS